MGAHGQVVESLTVVVLVVAFCVVVVVVFRLVFVRTLPVARAVAADSFSVTRALVSEEDSAE